MLPQTKLDKHPRMADFALWATACETAFWPAGTFSAAYSGNRHEAAESVIDTDPVAGAVLAVMATRTAWKGTATDLLDELEEAAGERIAKSKDWPQSPRALSGRLRRAATFLRKIGIEIGFDREGRARTRMIRIGKGTPLEPETDGTQASTSSAPSAHAHKANDANGSARPDVRTDAVQADGLAGASMHRPSAKTH